MSYTNDLINYASKLDKPIQVERSDETHKYKVTIENIVYKQQHLRTNIFGIGFTIEDACYDFIRKCRGAELEDWKTNKKIEIY